MNTRLINITVPVYNEQEVLANNLGKLAAFLKSCFEYPFEIVVAENGSTDRTLDVARRLEAESDNIRVLHLNQKGRGGAIRMAWEHSTADVLSYLDVDLSTELSAFRPMIKAISQGGYDLAVGSRLRRSSQIRRGFKREIISRTYNLLVKAFFHTRFSDAQCGFKAISRRAAAELLHLVEDNGWFMDTELLVIAEKLGYKIFD